ncbi:hypothetical protein HDU84_004062 [Entophlyctis sp. JEL0112]|nr:hypothetical protein HDU84_004059 [Entophlyctis sp. JEL0112]KAJ3382781.1 hypothetical protein HDU84_004062 [Entophlyctis sp. JEL0112]
MTTPTVVVIGGSHAGTKTIKQLDATVKSKANIILIEERDSFYYTVAALRSVTEPNFAQHLWVPYTNLFLNNKSSKVIQGRAAQIREHEVVLADGQTVQFDYAVIATGVKVPAPGQMLKTTKQEGLAEANKLLNAVKNAQSIAIIGGGGKLLIRNLDQWANDHTAVGVELAGEIATDYRGKNVTIIHSGASLANRNDLKPKAAALINDQLKALGVTVKLNQRVLPDGDTILPDGASYSLTPQTLRTSTGDVVTADVVFLCTGLAIPNSAFVSAGLGDSALDSKGFVHVEETGQLKNFKHIFALGDVSDFDNVKLAYTTRAQSAVVASNITTLVTNSGSPLKTYTKQQPGAFAVIAIGRNGGVMQTPLGVFGAWTTKTIKSGNLFVPKIWTDMNLKSTYTGPSN